MPESVNALKQIRFHRFIFRDFRLKSRDASLFGENFFSSENPKVSKNPPTIVFRLTFKEKFSPDSNLKNCIPEHLRTCIPNSNQYCCVMALIIE